MYKFCKKKKHFKWFCCCVTAYDTEPTFPSITFLNEGHYVKTINCAFILWANNNKHTKTKQNQTKTQKPRFTKQYSYQHQIKQLCHSETPRNPDRNHMNGK